jgi:hypothetical protein
MRVPERRGRPEAEGFILVGVVTFMLALTILGLSLFALSSYEAQFFQQSAAHEQSFENAESGAELVKGLLAMSPQRLENANLAVGQAGVTRAIAYQWRSPLPNDTTSVGPVRWDSTIVIAVTARSRGAERTLQARYIPIPGDSPYRKLVAAGLGLHVNTENGGAPQLLVLNGGVWHPVNSSADTAWTAAADWASGRPLKPTDPPLPRANAFVDAKLPGASAPTAWSGGSAPYQLTLTNAGSTPRFFLSPPSPHDEHHYAESDEYSFFTDGDLRITVAGTAVWVIPQGACFRKDVTVVSNGAPATLVVVAKPNQRDPGYENRGLWFQGGLTVTDENMRVFLVSEGDIGVTHRYNPGVSQDVQAVSIAAAGRVELGGPTSGYRFRLSYAPSTMDALADQLLAQGALPPLTAGTGTAYVVARSTWVETTPR